MRFLHHKRGNKITIWNGDTQMFEFNRSQAGDWRLKAAESGSLHHNSVYAQAHTNEYIRRCYLKCAARRLLVVLFFIIIFLLPHTRTRALAQ